MAKIIENPGYKEDLKTFIHELEHWKSNKALWEYHEDRVRVKLFTDGHEYSISATPGYLGCGVSTRKPRPGEDWARGNDLADGEFSEGTWLRILKDIVAYELKSISDYIIERETIGDNNLTHDENQLEVVESW